ncbi:magnesium transporter NIPA-domain-containing protein [Pilaira anomala]|nr:magnesium transporter NIPA-domain-containing protein [Pilaira anomala]
MSSTNGTSNPFATDTTGSQAGLYKGIGVSLAVASGIFIGSSFVFKKKGLLQSIEQSGGVAGEGYTYLKSLMWWSGMILMIVGELCNFIAYAFTQAILVTPLGALSVVISAVLSSIFLKERLSFQGKVGCLQCILGAIVIVLHAPEQSSADSTIEAFKGLVLSVGFLVYGSIAVIVSLVLVFYCGPRWGKKNMLVYITVCSLIGSISVVFTQGLGSAIVHSATKGNENQFKNWFIYVVLAIVIVTLIVEIVYLNKALNLFNTALVTPTYYVIFTTMTIVSSIVLYRGFDASPVDVITCVLGFLNICSGVALLHNSKSQPSEIESPASLLSSSKKMDDDEKVLLDDENVPTLRRKSVFQMFENDEATKHSDDATASGNHGSQDPGAADLFPAPFSGISRYASTTKRSQSILNKHRLNKSNTADTLSASGGATTTVKSRPHSNTISIGNTVTGEEGYNRELKWRDYNNNATTGPAGQYHDAGHLQRFDDEDLKSITTTITSNNTYGRSTTTHHTTSTTTHRAQDELNPLSTFQLQIHGGEVDDRKGLVQQQDD